MLKALKVLGIALIALAFGILDAKIISDVWRWFAVPVLGLRPISILSAFGLNLLVIVFLAKPRQEPTGKEVIHYVSLVLSTWFIAFVAHLFM